MVVDANVAASAFPEDDSSSLPSARRESRRRTRVGTSTVNRA